MIHNLLLNITNILIISIISSFTDITLLPHYHSNSTSMRMIFVSPTLPLPPPLAVC